MIIQINHHYNGLFNTTNNSKSLKITDNSIRFQDYSQQIKSLRVLLTEIELIEVGEVHGRISSGDVHVVPVNYRSVEVTRLGRIAVGFYKLPGF